MEESGDEDDVPEGAVRFELEAAAIEAALAEQGIEVEAREDVDVRAAAAAHAPAASLLAAAGLSRDGLTLQVPEARLLSPVSGRPVDLLIPLALAPLPGFSPRQVPDALLPDDAVEALVAERQPRFVPLDGADSGAGDLARGWTRRRML